MKTLTFLMLTALITPVAGCDALSAVGAQVDPNHRPQTDWNPPGCEITGRECPGRAGTLN